jgi:phage repressor protein C with HTH and peptisase S24 domain
MTFHSSAVQKIGERHNENVGAASKNFCTSVAVDTQHLSTWLREQRQRLGWTAVELADRARAYARSAGDPIKLPQQVISHFESGSAKRVPRWLHYAQQAIAAADAGQPVSAAIAAPTPQQVRLQEMLTAARPEQLNAVAEYLTGHFDETGLRRQQLEEELDLVAIPSIDLAYGMGATFTDGHVDEDLQHFPRTWVQSISHSSPRLLTWSRGRGDSMTPTIHDGDIILFDRSQRHVAEQDAIWAFTIGDIGMIKRLRVRGPKVTILSDNPAVPPDEAHVDEVNVVARVVFIGRRV